MKVSCFENGAVKLSAKETKWTSLEVRIHPTFLETLILKYDSGPVKLPGLSRNRLDQTKQSVPRNANRPKVAKNLTCEQAHL